MSKRRSQSVESTPTSPEFNNFDAAIDQGAKDALSFLREESGVRPSSPQGEKDAAILPRAYQRLGEAVILFKNVDSEAGDSEKTFRPVIEAALTKVIDGITRRTNADLPIDPAVAAIAAMLGIDPSELRSPQSVNI
jgi:hypothetical protein